MKVIKHRFKAGGIKYEELSGDNNIRALGFKYLIPRPLFPPVIRLTRLYLYRENENPALKGSRYNFINLLFCWVGLPFGPVYAIGAFKNNVIGIDLTIDFKENIKKADFEKGFVKIETISEIFIKPDKEMKRSLIKAINKFVKDNGPLQSNILAGIKIDEENAVNYLGLHADDFEKKELILKYLQKYFYKHISFDFMNIDEPTPLANKFRNQGEIIVAPAKQVS